MTFHKTISQTNCSPPQNKGSQSLSYLASAVFVSPLLTLVLVRPSGLQKLHTRGVNSILPVQGTELSYLDA